MKNIIQKTGEIFVSNLLPNFNEEDISKKFESLVKKSKGEELLVYGSDIPMYVKSNWKLLNEKILENEGKIKMATYNTEIKIPKFISDYNGSLEIYKLNKPADFSVSILDNKSGIFSNTPGKFLLTENISGNRIKDLQFFMYRAQLELEKIELK